MLWKPTLDEASIVCQNPSMLIPSDPGAMPARNFCGFVEAASATDDLLPVDSTPAAAKAPAVFRKDLRSNSIFPPELRDSSVARADAISADDRSSPSESLASHRRSLLLGRLWRAPECCARREICLLRRTRPSPRPHSDSGSARTNWWLSRYWACRPGAFCRCSPDRWRGPFLRDAEEWRACWRFPVRRHVHPLPWGSCASSDTFP